MVDLLPSWQDVIGDFCEFSCSASHSIISRLLNFHPCVEIHPSCTALHCGNFLNHKYFRRVWELAVGIVQWLAGSHVQGCAHCSAE